MAEMLTLTAPVVTTRTTYRLAQLNMDWDGAHIHIRLVGSDGGDIVRAYDGAAATAKMTALNTANFSAVSFQKKLFQMLSADFPELAGGVSGVPI